MKRAVKQSARKPGALKGEVLPNILALELEGDWLV